MQPLRQTLRACCLAGLIFAVPAMAQDAALEMKAPKVALADVDWGAVRAALANFGTFDDAKGALARLNAATAKVFPNIAGSPVPVLLPFDTSAYLRDSAQGSAGDTSKYLSGFSAVAVFFPGPSGYDAALSLRPNTPGVDLTFAKPVEVQISGSALVYELGGPMVADGESVPQLDSQFPGIRRSLLESHLRYTFVRFGVPYVISIGCFDGPSSAHRLSCRDADKVALRFLNGLNVVGGTPQAGTASLTPQTIDRPEPVSPDFTYFAPGDILPGTGMHGQSGRADDTVYAKIRFPIAQAPDYAVSQSFMNWGNCDLTGRVGLGGRASNESYRCRVNDKPLVNDESKNFAYPWRDNFCEHRTYEVSQCPAGLGHQGQDIRPSSCLERDPNSGRCEPYQEDVVAVSDGVLMRDPGDRAIYLVVNEPGEHIRFRYLHMSPEMLDAAGMLSGRTVVEGEVLGAVGNYGNTERGTSYHLHFDAQVPTRAGWVFINPYMTLVAAYERLIGARGRPVNDAMFAPPPPTLPLAADGVAKAATAAPSKLAETPKSSTSDAIVGTKTESPAHKQANVETGNASAEHCTTYLHGGHRRSVCRSAVAGAHARTRHVRSVDSDIPEQSHSARRHGRHVHARHGGTSS
jgi:hypothetical protein